jgi:hypothetical protein
MLITFFSHTTFSAQWNDFYALHIAGANDKMNIVNFLLIRRKIYNLEWNNRWFFLALAYFGTDQSQVGRYLSGKICSWKSDGINYEWIVKGAMQFFILLLELWFCLFPIQPVPLKQQNNKVVIENSE